MGRTIFFHNGSELEHGQLTQHTDLTYGERVNRLAAKRIWTRGIPLETVPSHYRNSATKESEIELSISFETYICNATAAS